MTMTQLRAGKFTTDAPRPARPVRAAEARHLDREAKRATAADANARRTDGTAAPLDAGGQLAASFVMRGDGVYIAARAGRLVRAH